MYGSESQDRALRRKKIKQEKEIDLEEILDYRRREEKN